MGRTYGVERGPDGQYPDFPKRITYLIDPGGGVAQVYEVGDIDAHPDRVLEDIRSLSTTA